jgi:alcohol dehydrogenase class IV
MMLTARSLEDGPLITRIAPHFGARHAATLAIELEHVPLESVAAAVAAARRWSADTIVALGGASVIDAAKAVRICIAAGLTSPDDLGAFIDHSGPLINGLIPQLSIPTTLSGSECTRSFSATSFTQGLKRTYTNSGAACRVIIYDPLATVDTPRRLWLASGVMAIDRTVEVFCASPPHPVGDTLKLAAARELISNLPLTRQSRPTRRRGFDARSRRGWPTIRRCARNR